MTESRPPAPTRVADVAISLIRTWVPIGVGGALTWLAARTDFVIDPSTSGTVAIAVTTACAGLYYGLARLFEATPGSGRVPIAARTVGRWMLGGVVSRPLYVSEAEYARLMALATDPPSTTKPG